MGFDKTCTRNSVKRLAMHRVFFGMQTPTVPPCSIAVNAWGVTDWPEGFFSNMFIQWNRRLCWGRLFRTDHNKATFWQCVMWKTAENEKYISGNGFTRVHSLIIKRMQCFLIVYSKWLIKKTVVGPLMTITAQLQQSVVRLGTKRPVWIWITSIVLRMFKIHKSNSSIILTKAITAN